MLTWLQIETHVVWIKMAIALAVGAGGVLFCVFHRLRKHKSIVVLSVVFTLITLVAFGSYMRFGHFRSARFINFHDVYHYYMGSKYHAELGYSNLYRATVLADMQCDQAFRHVHTLRDLDTLKHLPRLSALADAQEVLAPFTPERWRAFKNDFKWLADNGVWPRSLLSDMGHNATPFWNAMASEITNRVPTGSITTMTLLCSVDFLLLGIMLVVIARTCGYFPMLLCASFFAINYSLHAWTIKGAILRMDWLVALVISVCMLKVHRYKTAGLFMSFAVLVRIFPLFLVFGLAVKAVAHLIRHRRLAHGHRAFFASLAITTALLVSASVVHAGGIHQWRAFAAKVGGHSLHIAPKRIGMTYALLSEEQTNLPAIRQAQQAGRGAVELGAILLVVVVVAAASRRLEDYQTTALGVVLVFFFVNLTWYYYSLLLIPCLVFALRLDRPANALGLLLLCGYTIAAYYIYRHTKSWLPRSAAHSDLLLAYLIALLILMWGRTANWRGWPIVDRLRLGPETAGDSHDASRSNHGRDHT